MREKRSERNYWVQVFTPSTWQRFLQAGGTITGFRQLRWNYIQQIKPGDWLLCYLSGLSKWVAVLEVISEPYLDTSRIWAEDLFPCRADVKIVWDLPVERAVPILSLRDKLSIFHVKNWSLYLISSPKKWTRSDADVVVNAIRNAAA